MSNKDNIIDNSNVYIRSFEARYFYGEDFEINKVYKFDNTRKKKVKDKNGKIKYVFCYNCSIPYSLELIYAQNKWSKFTKYKDGIPISDNIVNISFDQDLLEKIVNEETGKTTYKAKKKKTTLRKELLKTGFWITDETNITKHFVFYKRGSNKVKKGSAFFICDKYYKAMIQMSNMGIQFDKYKRCIDIASLEVYIALVSSSIKDIIKIDPKHILLIDDLKSNPFKQECMVTRNYDIETEKNNSKKNVSILKTDKELYEISNVLWDGEGLIDKSLLTGQNQGKGMVLLRQGFMKCCAFSSNIRQFFSDRDISKVANMFGDEIDAEQVELITTPSSIKLFKYVDIIPNAIPNQKHNPEIEKKNLHNCWTYWQDHVLDYVPYFGIIKNEHASKFGTYNKLSYQMLQAMNLSYSETKDLMSDELQFIDLLQNNLAVFRWYLSNNGQIRESNTMSDNLLSVSDEFQYTKLFKNFRKSRIQDYKDTLRHGEIKINDTDYATVCSSPIELLSYAAYGKGYKYEPILKERQVYCTRVEDGQNIAIFRNPLVCCGNVCCAKNTYNELVNRYMNLTDNIVIVNGIDDLFDRNNGMDTDSDEILISCQKIIVQHAQENEQKWLTPINGVVASKVKKTLNNKNIALIDNTISKSKSLIGKIINQSCMLNGLIWDELSKDSPDMIYVNNIYKDICTLAVMSNIQIDSAKKQYKINLNKQLSIIKQHQYKLQENERPYFMKFTAPSDKYSYFKINTPMDYVQEIIDDIKRPQRKFTIGLYKVINNTNNLDCASKYQANTLADAISQLNNEFVIQSKKPKDEREWALYHQLKKEILSDIKKYNMTSETIEYIIKRINDKDSKYTRVGIKLLSLIYKVYPEKFVNIFKSNRQNISILQLDENGQISFFDKNYTEILV
jgi:hypothetical protein